MQVRNLLIAAGAALAATTAIAAAPTAASAQGYYRPYYAPYRAEPVRAFDRFEAHRYWEHRRYEAWRFHHRPFYRYY